MTFHFVRVIVPGDRSELYQVRLEAHPTPGAGGLMDRWCLYSCSNPPSHTLLLTRGLLGCVVLIGLAYWAYRKDWESTSAVLGVAAFGVLIWHVTLWLS
jgi:hypothetical protein